MSDKVKIIARLMDKPMCTFSNSKTVNDYNKQAGSKVVKRCDDMTFWHDTYCKKHHLEGWGNCTCCNWRL